MERRLFSIGHSTHPLSDFLELLARYGVEALADVRKFPGSRRSPQFHRDFLAAALPAAGVEYRWIERLGGRRGRARGAPASRNLGLRNQSFRNYADYMATDEFRGGIKELLELVDRKPTAVMCAEGLYWRCHRRLIADYLLLTQGLTVQHIMPNGALRRHLPIEGASCTGGEVIYPAPPAGEAPEASV